VDFVGLRDVQPDSRNMSPSAIGGRFRARFDPESLFAV
jgi:hypothetical protein